MLSPVIRTSNASSSALATPVRRSSNAHVVQNPINAPAQHTSFATYKPKGKGIRVVQQYVNSIPRKPSSSKPSEQEEDICDYDFIGAVGLKTNRSGDVVVLYHVKWKGFGIRAMTWEPEDHFFGPDLEALWAKHGRVNSAGEILGMSGRHGKQLHPYALDKGDSESHEMDGIHFVNPGLFSRDSLPATPVSPHDEVVGLEDDGSNHRITQDTSISRISAELASSGNKLQERHTCSVCESCLSTCDQMSTCSPVRSGIEQQPSKLNSFEHYEPGRAEQTSFEGVHQRVPAKSLRPSRSNGIFSSDRPLQATRGSYGDRSKVSAVCSPLIAQHTGPFQKASHTRRKFCRRTRTGCFTCRRRKKKCDEQWPSCKSFLCPTVCIQLQPI